MTMYVMIGLPAVGKSKWARERFDEEQIYSSDEYRERLYGDINDMSHNADVFERIYTDMDKALASGDREIIVFDATNLNIKRRKLAIELAHKNGTPAVAVVLTEPLGVVLERNSQRKRVVPEDIIRKKYAAYHVPVITEGFNDVIYHSTGTQIRYIDIMTLQGRKWRDEVERISECSRLSEMRGFDQHNPHHTLDLWNHTLKMMSHVHKHNPNNWRLKMAALYHDIGKLDTQIFGSDGIAHYFGHQYVSTQIAVQELRQDVYDSDLMYITSLIHYHMDAYNVKTMQDIPKFARRIGDPQLFYDLLLLHEADEYAH